jgi:hypothetical protein
MARTGNCGLFYLTVLLTLAASGDDINLVRLAMPAAFASSPVGSLPLDDENMDFVRPPELQLSLYLPLTPIAWCFSPVHSLLGLSSHLVFCIDSPHHLPCHSALPPLRC